MTQCAECCQRVSCPEGRLRGGVGWEWWRKAWFYYLLPTTKMATAPVVRDLTAGWWGGACVRAALACLQTRLQGEIGGDLDPVGR